MSLTALHFKENTKIQFINKKLTTYYKTNIFNREEAKSRNWHEIVIHHEAKYSKKDVLFALFNTIGNTTFYPVNYIEGQMEDRFYVRLCFDALETLFNKYLELDVPQHAPPIHLSIRLCVANHAEGQIYPETRMDKAVESLYLKLQTHCGVTDVLNLENFIDNSELSEVVIYLGVPAIFASLCNVLSRKHNIINSINGINFSNNNIKSLLGITHLTGCKFDIIDLRSNRISDIHQLYQLKCIHLKELNTSSNPVEKSLDFLENIKEKLTELKKLNGVQLSDINVATELLNFGDSEVELNGHSIRIRNLNQFNTMSHANSNWHQIIIKHNGLYKKSEIVEALFYNFIVENNYDPFYICYYKVGATEDSFLFRNHYQHLKILFTNCMSLTIKNDGIKMQLLADVATFKKEKHVSEELINKALRECYNDGVLDLSNFELSKTLKDKLIFNTGLPKIYGKLITQTLANFGNIVKINLSNNRIFFGTGLKSLNQIKTLKSLNLSNNKLSSITDLKPIEKMTITELWLDGNPLCKKYDLSKDYISVLKAMFPELKILDGVTLEEEGAFVSKKNFLCNMEAFDLIEQFVGNYFKIFDSQNKEELISMYSTNGMFTLGNYSERDKRTKLKNSNMNKFENFSRNLIPSNGTDKKKDITEIMDCTKNFYVNPHYIYNILKSLPRFQHDFHSFTTDVHFYKPELVIFTITGVLMVLGNTIIESNQNYAFSRNFVLKRSGTNMGIFSSTSEYQITNDQLVLTDMSPQQQRQAFRYQNPEDNQSLAAIEEDKSAFLIMFQQLTSLKTVWCTKILEDGDYDFPKSLEIFLDLMKKDKIPKNGFISSEQ